MKGEPEVVRCVPWTPGGGGPSISQGPRRTDKEDSQNSPNEGKGNWSLGLGSQNSSKTLPAQEDLSLTITGSFTGYFFETTTEEDAGTRVTTPGDPWSSGSRVYAPE